VRKVFLKGGRCTAILYLEGVEKQGKIADKEDILCLEVGKMENMFRKLTETLINLTKAGLYSKKRKQSHREET